MALVKRHWKLAALNLILLLMVAGLVAYFVYDPSGADATAQESGAMPSVPGLPARINPDANPQVASVAEALRTGTHPERLSVLIKPAQFDAAAYRLNPSNYLDVVEPGRVWDTAQPGEGVKPIESTIATHVRMAALATEELAVRIEPGAPATFTSLDMGAFDNQLTSITVRADDQGLATAQFTAIAGTVGRVTVLAASPSCSGQVAFRIRVQEPE